MLRTKLLLAIAVSLAVVFIMAVLLFWGPGQMARELDRSLLAHEQTEGYLRLSSETYRHFWELADQLIALEASGLVDRQLTSARIREQLRELELLTIEELRHVGDSEPDEWQELLRIKELADAIAAGVIAFNHVLEQTIDTKDRTERLALLKQKIDFDFARLINEAIIDEREEAVAADLRVRDLVLQLRWSAAVLSILAMLLIGGLGYWLIRHIKNPIEQLLLGTQKVAAGDLGHRIELRGRDEFAHLADSFNGMAGDLERQRGALMQAQAGLEEKVRERTSELEQANLTLQRLDDVRRQMFADISHELRTPLTIISGEAEVTLRNRNVRSEDYQVTLGRIIDLTGQVANLVEDLTFLARSDTADLRVHKRPVRAADVLNEATEDLRALASSKDIKVELQVSLEAEGWLDADPNRLSQLLLILVDNACRYSETGGRITMSLDQRLDEVFISVADKGIGIPPSEVDVVFDRYFRGERARHLAPKGVGLGLHVAKTIAEVHGGRLMVDSKPDVGTTVTLALPVLQSGPIHQPDNN